MKQPKMDIINRDQVIDFILISFSNEKNANAICY